KHQPRLRVAIRSWSRSTGPFASGRAFAAMTKSIATLLCPDRIRHEQAHGIADAHAARLDDSRVHAERQPLGATLRAVRRQGPERVEVGLARVGALGRDRAPADVSDRRYDRVADRHSAPDPLVLLVRLDAVDLEQHPEAAAVDGAC